MPAGADAPPVLAEALGRMEALVQSFKKSLPFTAPEMMDERYIELQVGLAETLVELYEASK